MREIQLLHGRGVAIVDDADYEMVAGYRWYLAKGKYTSYARASTVDEGGRWGSIPMHRLILGASAEDEVDHKNRNGLDNRRENLRTCSGSQNQRNAPKRADNTSGFRGVYFDCSRLPRRSPWRAMTSINVKNKHLGYYPTAAEAAEHYDRAVLSLAGEHAETNFPKEFYL